MKERLYEFSVKGAWMDRKWLKVWIPVHRLLEPRFQTQLMIGPVRISRKAAAEILVAQRRKRLLGDSELVRKSRVEYVSPTNKPFVGNVVKAFSL